MFLQNVRNHIQDYAASQPRNPQSTPSLPWEPHVSVLILTTTFISALGYTERPVHWVLSLSLVYKYPSVNLDHAHPSFLEVKIACSVSLVSLLVLKNRMTLCFFTYDNFYT
jgi:hypothetical protein